MSRTPTTFEDDADLDALRDFRSDLTHIDDERIRAARERLAGRVGSDRPSAGSRRTTQVLVGVVAVGVAAAVAGVVVWSTSGGSPKGTAPAGPATSSASASTSSPSDEDIFEDATPAPVPGGDPRLFGPGGPLHCMAMHDEPLGEVAKKVGRTDLEATYTLPDPKTETTSHLTQAQAEADTDNKVSEVIARGGNKVEIYFWGKDNPDFQSPEMVEEFERACPDPR